MCQAPCGKEVEPEDCRIAACPAGTVMVRARSEKDTSYTDRCFRCPAGTFQIFSTILRWGRERRRPSGFGPTIRPRHGIQHSKVVLDNGLRELRADPLALLGAEFP